MANIKFGEWSEPDEDGMVNCDIEFEDEESYKELKEMADAEGLEIGEFISKTLIEYAKTLNDEDKDAKNS